MIEFSQFKHLTVPRISARLGEKDLVIIELEGRIEAILAIPGVQEAIAIHQQVAQNGHVAEVPELQPDGECG